MKEILSTFEMSDMQNIGLITAFTAQEGVFKDMLKEEIKKGL